MAAAHKDTRVHEHTHPQRHAPFVCLRLEEVARFYALGANGVGGARGAGEGVRRFGSHAVDNGHVPGLP